LQVHRKPSHVLTSCQLCQPNFACERGVGAGSVTGPVSIWKVGGGWEHIKTLSGHSAAVNDIAAHPTGTIALSASRDKQLRLWDLCKGSCAYQAALGGEGELVSFLPGGEQFLIGTGTAITLHSTKVRQRLSSWL
jgi:WD40 repeat protein